MPDGIDIQLNLEECIGCAACETEAPETFEMDDEPKVVLKKGPHDDKDLIIAAAENCPTDCIMLVDQQSGQTIYPAD